VRHFVLGVLVSIVVSIIMALSVSASRVFQHLTSWEKRAFITVSLLLIAILGFGIGFLFDQIGLLQEISEVKYVDTLRVLT